jgi:hypothetical protein
MDQGVHPCVPGALAVSINAHRLAALIESTGTRFAELDHAYRLLERTKASVLAQIVIQHRDTDLERSEPVAMAKMRAEASEEWLNHLYAMEDARYAAALAKLAWEAARSNFDAWRTEEASRRAEMQNLAR